MTVSARNGYRCTGVRRVKVEDLAHFGPGHVSAGIPRHPYIVKKHRSIEGLSTLLEV
jgi:hypothetical protein